MLSEETMLVMIGIIWLHDNNRCAG